MNRAGWWSHLTALLTDLDHPAERLMAFVAEWNAHAHPFNWSTKSAAKVMAKYQAQPLLAPATCIPLLFSAVAYSEEATEQ